MPILLIILLLTLIEIATFVLVGGWIGLWPVLALTLLSVFAGVGVLRHQGARSAALARGGLAHVSPGTFLAQGAFAVLAGVLLLLPGLVTDVLGLLLLLPPLQRLLMRAIAARIDPQQPQPAPGEAEIIEGSFHAEDDATPPGARRHNEITRRRPDAPPDDTRPGQGGPRSHRGH